MTAAPRSAKPNKASAVRVAALERVRTLISALSHSARAVERSTGVTNAQLFLLQQLAGADSLSVNDLAARARTQQSTVSIVVARLVRAGLAAKRKSAADGRIAAISLTAKGRRLLAHAPAPPTSLLLHAIEALSDREARALAEGVRALVGALDLSPPEVTMLFEHAPVRRSTPARPQRTATRSRKRHT
ncbi:MAG TPA: MarR family winged helix-turn-helix transcriptional regulator [Gemmatimonadaceae bacterium]|nr:MarR family winged helix-turn-helix transcriptional regulator [Gemmatimonadaceae bacterium]